MTDKITHEQARLDVMTLNRTNLKLRLENEHEGRLQDYITQQEKKEKLLELYQDLVEELGLEVEDKVFSKSALNIYIKIKRLENE